MALPSCLSSSSNSGNKATTVGDKPKDDIRRSKRISDKGPVNFAHTAMSKSSVSATIAAVIASSANSLTVNDCNGNTDTDVNSSCFSTSGDQQTSSPSSFLSTSIASPSSSSVHGGNNNNNGGSYVGSGGGNDNNNGSSGLTGHSSISGAAASYHDSEPPFLAIGTDVSAKYKGAFCEAKIKNIVRLVKCRVTFRNNGGSAIILDNNVKGPLRVGAQIEAKHPDKNQFLAGVINKIIDASQYTVVFDDGDETTLRRTSLCLKSGKHFAESESLDHLPLTNPEHFGNPVNLGIRGTRRRRKRISGHGSTTYSSTATMSDVEDNESAEGDGLLPSGSIDDDDSASNMTQQSGSVRGGKEEEDKLIERDPDWGRVVCVEYGDKRGNKTKDSWFPALIVRPAAQESNPRLDVKEEHLVKSFINGRYYQVMKKDVKDLTKKHANNLISDSNTSVSLRCGLEKALSYIEKDDLPFSWDVEALLGIDSSSMASASAASASKGGDTGAISSEFDSIDEDDEEDVDEPFEAKDRFVAQLYKYMDERGTPLNKAPTLGGKDLDLYKLYRIVAKCGGYNRVTNKNLWKKVYIRMNLPSVESTSTDAQINQLKGAYKKYLLSFDDFYRKLGCTMVNHTLTSRSSGRLARSERNWRGSISEKDKEISTSKSRRKSKSAGDITPGGNGGSVIEKKDDIPAAPSSIADDKSSAAGEDEEKSGPTTHRKGKRRGKFGRKRGPKSVADGDESNTGDGYDRSANADSETESETEYDQKMPTISKEVEVNVDDRIRVKYGKGKGMKIYEAKVLKSNNDADLSKRKYFVHYTGWNVRYDEWIKRNRIVELVRDKVTRRKGGKARNRGQPVASNDSPDRSSKQSQQDEDSTTRDSKETKTPSKRGRPVTENKSLSSSGNKSRDNKPGLTLSKRRSKAESSLRREIKEDPDEKNIDRDEDDDDDDEDEDIVEDEEIDEREERKREKEFVKKETQKASESTDENEPEVKIRKTSNSLLAPEVKLEKDEQGESTDLDILEASANSNDENIKEESVAACGSKENVYDILVCDENLDKSPPPRPMYEILESPKKDDVSVSGGIVVTPVASTPSPAAAMMTVSVAFKSSDESTKTPASEKESDRGKQQQKRKRSSLAKSTTKEEKRKSDDEGDVDSSQPSETPSSTSKRKKKEHKESDSILDANDDNKRQSFKSLKKKRKSSPIDSSSKETETGTSTPASGSVSGDATDDSELLALKKRKRILFASKRNKSLQSLEPCNDNSSIALPNKVQVVSDQKLKEQSLVVKKKSLSASKQEPSTKPNVVPPTVTEAVIVTTVQHQIETSTDQKEKEWNEECHVNEEPEAQIEEEVDEVELEIEEGEKSPEEPMEVQETVIEKVEESVDLLSAEVGGSFLLCKEEVPASPVHRAEAIEESKRALAPGLAIVTASAQASIDDDDEDTDLQPSSSGSSSNLPNSKSVQEAEKVDRAVTPTSSATAAAAAAAAAAGNDSHQFTPPTTPESLKSGTLSSSTPPHDRESDSEQRQAHGLPEHERLYHSGIDVSKVNLSSMAALDNLASVASSAPVKSIKGESPPPPTSDESNSRNAVSDFQTNNNVKDGNSNNNSGSSSKKENHKSLGLTSPLCSPKKKRKGRVRTSSTSESIKDEKIKSSAVGCKTRSSLSRKTRQHHSHSHHHDNIESLISESPSSISCSFSAIKPSDYSPNGFMGSVKPSSKYNFCEPIDENLETDKRINILQDRLSELRKTYMNIKAEVASIERRRKKARKRDKDRDLSSPSGNGKDSSNDRDDKSNSDSREAVLGSSKHPSEVS